MNATLRQDFQRFNDTQGYCTPPGKTACALQSARTLEHWRIQEAAGRVRLRAEAEEENYFDVYGEPEGYTDIHGRHVSAEEERKRIVELIERQGCWLVVAEYRCSHCGEWKHASSIGMCIHDNPLDPFQNDYIVSLMVETLDALN